MARILLWMAVAGLAGCVAMPDLGGYYDPARRPTGATDAARVVVYVDSRVDPALYFLVSADAAKDRKLVHGSFLDLDVPAGTITVRASEWWTGEGFLQDLNPSGMFDKTHRTGPDTMTAGAVATISVAVETGAAAYLKITKRESVVLVECASDRETVTYCRETVFAPSLETVTPDIAGNELRSLREALP